MASDEAGAAPKRRFSSSAQIAVGIASGAALRLFAGERTSSLQFVADSYIKLLQMTGLPCVTVSIIGGLGALDAAQARALGASGAHPGDAVGGRARRRPALPSDVSPHQSASFFSTALLQERRRSIPQPLHSDQSVQLTRQQRRSRGRAVQHRRRQRSSASQQRDARACSPRQDEAVSKATNFVVALDTDRRVRDCRGRRGNAELRTANACGVCLVSSRRRLDAHSACGCCRASSPLTPVPHPALIARRTRDAL